jgi:GDP-4-dehydro-6-deoxy-D-mannose reductase
MKAFITGSRGFSGRHLVALLKKHSIQTFGFTDDLRDRQAVNDSLKKINPDWIFHLASPIIRSDRLLDETLVANLEVDLFGTIYLIQAAANLKKKPKILITGSNAEYAAKNQLLRETDKLMPLTGYGLSKLTQEMVSLQLASSYGLDLIMTRTFHLVGPGQRPGFVVTDLAKAITQGETKITLGNPAIQRDFTDVRDAVRAYYLLMKQGKRDETYNVCSGKTVSVGEIADRLIKISGKNIKLKSKTLWRKNDPKTIGGDHTKLTKATGWQPQISLDQSLKETLNYWRKR